MASSDAGRPASRRNSNVSLGLVGVPTMQESVQTAEDFDFDFDPDIDLDALDALNADIDAFCADGLPKGQSLNDLGITPALELAKTTFESSDLPQAYLPEDQFTFTYDPMDLSSFSVQQNLAYPEPQGYYSAHETPYFDNCYSNLAPSRDMFGNPSLAAVPGNNAFVDFESIQYPSQPYASQAQCWTVPINTGSMAVDPALSNDTTIPYASYPREELRKMATIHGITIGPGPRTGAPAQPKGRRYESDSDSDDEYREITTKTTKAIKRAKCKQGRNSSVSSASTTTATPSEPVKYQPGEKPKKVDAKPWIRTNANTEGDTRTAKINNWKNKYQYKPLPLGNWNSGKHTYRYTQYENVDFLTEAPMSTRKIKEYILKYPSDDNKRLILWIQKMPADQGRRYGSKQHSKCAFRDCPIQRYVEGTISTGEYRVAFDEKHFTHAGEVDPYDCTAYAHLYCMEQFLDFEQVCQVADVRIDTRLDMPLEPNGKAAFSMTDVPSRYEMERFVKAAAKGKLRQTQKWYNYPVHADYDRDQQKPHERTLTYLAHCMYEAHQDDSHKKQAALRKVTVSQRRVHLGDLEMSVTDKRIMIEAFGGKKKGRKGKVEDYYDDHIRRQIARAQQEAHDFLQGKVKGKNSAKKVRKRKTAERNESDDNELMCDDWAVTSHTRASRHKKQRVNYAESPIDVMQQYAPQQYVPNQYAPVAFMQPPTMQVPEQQVQQQLQMYVATNPNACGPVVSQSTAPIDPALNTPYGLYAVPTTPKLDINDFDMENFPACEDDLPDDNLEKLLSLDRRQSCTAESGPMMPLTGRTPRRAVFDEQPVSQSKEYGVNEPPSAMSGRRSARLAAKH